MLLNRMRTVQWEFKITGKDVPAINDIFYSLCFTGGVIFVEVADYPFDEVVLESPLD